MVEVGRGAAEGLGDPGGVGDGLGPVSEFADAFEDDGALIIDVIECEGEAGPVDDAEAWGPVEVGAAVVVVDMGGPEAVLGGGGGMVGGIDESGVSGIERETEGGVVDLGDDACEVGHVGTGMDAVGHVFEGDEELGGGGAIGEGGEGVGEGSLAFVVIEGIGGGAWVYDEE